MTLHEYLQTNRLISDGSMGTYFESMYGDSTTSIVERENEYHPERIQNIHRNYINSGARLIRTNTFATNSLFFNTPAQIAANIRAGYRLATAVAAESNQKIFVAADIGPISESEEKEHETLIQEYKLIVDTFLNEGADIFVFETFSDISVIPELTQYIKTQNRTSFIQVQCAFDQSGYTKLGLSLKRMESMLAYLDSIDGFGLNCGLSPTHMYKFLKKIDFPKNKFISALPNASYPLALRGKTVYSENLHYFVEVMHKIEGLGVDIIGGCCGTTPEHIAALSASLANKRRSTRIQIVGQNRPQPAQPYTETPPFLSKLEQGEKIYMVELDPPFDCNDIKVMNGAKILKEANVDAMTLADSPLGRPRADATHLAVKVQYKTGLPVIAHLSCRDKNVIGLRSILLGSHLNELRNFLIVTGDPINKTEHDKIKSVYQFNSIKLMQYIQSMNEEICLEQKIHYGGALNYHGINIDRIADRMKRKMAAGAQYFLTQPIFTDEDITRIVQLREMTGAKIMCGIMPLVSYRNASFIKNEMPGIHVSDEILDRYHPDMTKEENETVATSVSLDIARKLLPDADGFYFMTPFNRVTLIRDILIKIRNEAMSQQKKQETGRLVV